MNIVLCHVTEQANFVNKDTTKRQLTISNVIFKKDATLDVLQPTLQFIIPKDTFGDAPDYSLECSEYAQFNYFWFPRFQRYYFIEKMSFNGAICEIVGRCDVLMSWKDSLIGTQQYVSRSQKYRNKDIVDNMLPIHSDYSYEVYTFGEPVFDKQCSSVILETIGKEVSANG